MFQLNDEFKAIQSIRYIKNSRRESILWIFYAMNYAYQGYAIKWIPLYLFSNLYKLNTVGV